MKNYYHVLNIPTQATQAQIKAAYKARQAEWNATDSQNMSSYMDIEEAWENLGDDMRRKWYDERFLSKIEQEVQANQARAEKIYEEVTKEIAEKKSSASLGKKVAVGGLSGGAIFFVMHFAFMVFHLAPHDEPVFKRVEFSNLDSTQIRNAMDSIIVHHHIDTSSNKQNSNDP